jgi:hypothetical protein
VTFAVLFQQVLFESCCHIDARNILKFATCRTDSTKHITVTSYAKTGRLSVQTLSLVVVKSGSNIVIGKTGLQNRHVRFRSCMHDAALQTLCSKRV